MFRNGVGGADLEKIHRAKLTVYYNIIGPKDKAPYQSNDKRSI